MVPLSAAILAGGKNTRADGQNKAFLRHEDQTFIERTLLQLSAFDEVLISARDRTVYAHLPYIAVEDEAHDVGPLGGIYTCLKYCRNEHLFVTAADMPNVTKELVAFMAEFISSDYDCYVLRAGDAIQPLCAIYTKALIPLMEQMLEEQQYSLRALLDRAKVKYIPLEYSRFDESAVLNINTLAEYAAFARAAAEKTPIVFAVSGVKNSGKTTLITKLIATFKAEGYRVGVIKHDGHDFEPDVPNTDTHQFRAAGCDATLIYSKTKLAFVRQVSGAYATELIGWLRDCDIVIIEGLKDATDIPKIEMVLDNPVCPEESVLAFASAGGYRHPQIPSLSRDDIEGLVSILKKRLF